MRLRLLGLLVVLTMTAAACVNLPGSSSVEPMVVTATFARTANLFIGSEVRVLGLQVGEITDIEAMGDSVEVELTLDGEREYPADVAVNLQPVSLLGERFAQMDPPYGGGPTLQNGAAIPISRTTIPAEVDEVLRSFENFLESLDAGALSNLIDVLADTLDGNGEGLNDLVDSGATTIRVLSDSSVDLNGLVDELATLNETLATREDRIGSTLVNTSTVLRNLQDDRDLLIGALSELTRATAELRPLVFEHADPLVRDLDVLATTLSTVDRNLERLGTTFFGAQRLFNTAGRVIDYENAQLPLDNEAEYLSGFIVERLSDRILGLCLRLDLADCGQVDDILDQLPPLCVPPACAETGEGGGTTTFAVALGTVLSELSPESRTAIAEEIEVQQEVQEAIPVPPPSVPTLPQVDPRLDGRGSTPTQSVPSIPGFGGDR